MAINTIILAQKTSEINWWLNLKFAWTKRFTVHRRNKVTDIAQLASEQQKQINGTSEQPVQIE